MGYLNLSSIILCLISLSAGAQTAQDLVDQRKAPWLEVISADHCNERLSIDSTSVTSLLAKTGITQLDPLTLASRDQDLLDDLEVARAGGATPRPIFKKGPLAWVPNAQPRQPNKSECSADTLESGLLIRRTNRFERNQFLSGFLARCDQHLTRNAPPFWWSLLQLDNIDYNFCENPRVRKVRVHLPDGRILTAWLALKEDRGPRPLVIAKSGIFSNPGGPSQRFMLMHLFDESPFHVLLLANGTGNQFAIDNHFLEFGGVDEGAEILNVAKLVNQADSPLKPFISSTHVVTVSLGSHAGLYSALYNTHNKDANGTPILKSVNALCPVVDLTATFQDNFRSGGLRSRVLAYVAWVNLFASREYIPKVLQLVPPGYFSLDIQQTPSIMAQLAMDDYPRRGPDWLPPPLAQTKMKEEPTFWTLNHFANHQDLVKTPVFVFASQDDPIVPTPENAAALIRDGVANQASSALQVAIAPQGSHCAFSTTYGWDIMSSVLRAQILSETPPSELPPKMLTLAPSLLPPSAQLAAQERYYAANWEFEMATRVLKLKLDISKPNSAVGRGSRCPSADISDKTLGCLRQVNFEVKPEQLGIGELPTPRTQVEAQVLTRWANSNLRLTDSQSSQLSSLNQTPTHLIVKTPY